MSLVKESQSFLEGTDLPVVDTGSVIDTGSIDVNDLKMTDPLEDIIVIDEPLEEASIEVDQEPELVFSLDKIPGAMNQDDIVEEPAEIVVEEPEEIEVNDDPWAWKLDEFPHWFSSKMNHVPPHSGHDIPGCHRAVAYLKRLKKEGLKAVSEDINGKLDLTIISEAMRKIDDGIDALEERIEKLDSARSKKRKKRSEDDSEEMIKTAGTPRIVGITVTVPLLISSLARSCINSTISAGKDMEKTFAFLCKEYELTKQSKLELIQLITDMGFPMRRDLGMPLDKEIDTQSVDNVSWMPNYHA